MKFKIEGKICGVCGDKALGCNFNAITCESCKAFFRRNALLQKDFKCPFSEHCEITPVTRRFCQKCRLDKCFSIGMCKNLIMSEEDKEMKRKKIVENRCRKRMGVGGFKKGFKKVKKESYSSDSRDSDTAPSQHSEDMLNDDRVPLSIHQDYPPQAVTDSGISTVISFIENSGAAGHRVTENFASIPTNDTQLVSSSDDISMIRSMLNKTPQSQSFDKSEDKAVNVYECSFKSVHTDNNGNIEVETNVVEEVEEGISANISSSGDFLYKMASDTVEDVQSSSVELNSLESILCEAIKLEFQAFSPMGQNHSKELNDAERAKLNELIVANKVLTVPLDEDLQNSLLGQVMDPQSRLEADPVLLDVINLTAIAIRRLIKMAKKINSFKNMCQEDQVALLKGGATEIMLLRSALNYDSKKHSWQIPQKQRPISLNVDVLKLGKNNAYEEHEKFIKNFDPRWRSDENVILIMCAIILFTPSRPKVVHKDVIKLEQNSYYYLLKRYLECTYPGCEAKSTFLKLMQKISELHVLNEELVNVYLNVNPSQVEPLLIELFDLKY